MKYGMVFFKSKYFAVSLLISACSLILYGCSGSSNSDSTAVGQLVTSVPTSGPNGQFALQILPNQATAASEGYSVLKPPLLQGLDQNLQRLFFNCLKAPSAYIGEAATQWYYFRKYPAVKAPTKLTNDAFMAQDFVYRSSQSAAQVISLLTTTNGNICMKKAILSYVYNSFGWTFTLQQYDSSQVTSPGSGGIEFIANGTVPFYGVSTLFMAIYVFQINNFVVFVWAAAGNPVTNYIDVPAIAQQIATKYSSLQYTTTTQH
jgi:hypothetical protein